jgi:5'-3' exonuclease
MGIKNLLPSLKQISKKRHVKEYSGMTVGIDTLCWMHQGVHKYAKDLINSNQNKKFCHTESFQRMVDYCIAKIRVLQVNGVKCLMVFDGAKLEMKKKVEDDREKSRQDSVKRAT